MLSGVLIAANSNGEGIVLTAAHLLRDSPTSFQVGIVGAGYFHATVVTSGRWTGNGYEPDVCVLHVTADQPLPSVPLASQDVRAGARLGLHGFPGGVTKQSHRTGHVLTVDRYRGSHTASLRTFSGDSGSGVFSGGLVVGVQWGWIDGQTFYTPASEIRSLIAVTQKRYSWCQPYQQHTQPVAQRPAARQQPNNYDARFTRLENLYATLRDRDKHIEKLLAQLESTATQLASEAPSVTPVDEQKLAARITAALDERLASLEDGIKAIQGGTIALELLDGDGSVVSKQERRLDGDPLRLQFQPLEEK